MALDSLTSLAVSSKINLTYFLRYFYMGRWQHFLANYSTQQQIYWWRSPFFCSFLIFCKTAFCCDLCCKNLSYDGSSGIKPWPLSPGVILKSSNIFPRRWTPFILKMDTQNPILNNSGKCETNFASKLQRHSHETLITKAKILN